MPTVVDIYNCRGLTGYGVNKKMPNMMVTPRDIDKLIDRAARLIACGINLALHPQMTFEDVESLA